jgi:PITH domain
MSCTCNHSHDGPEAAEGESLLPYIDTDRVVCLNEERSGSAKHVLKPYTARADKHCSVTSPSGDPLLVFKIPFSAAVKVRSICISAGAGKAPTKAKLFVSDSIDASSALENKPDQEISLTLDETGDLWYPLKGAKFSSCHYVTVALPPPAEDEDTSVDQYEIFYLGLKGESTGLKRLAVSAVYEARAMKEDHQTKDESWGGTASTKH